MPDFCDISSGGGELAVRLSVAIAVFAVVPVDELRVELVDDDGGARSADREEQR